MPRSSTSGTTERYSISGQRLLTQDYAHFQHQCDPASGSLTFKKRVTTTVVGGIRERRPFLLSTVRIGSLWSGFGKDVMRY